MGRIQTVAAGVGVLDGVWIIVVQYLGHICTGGPCVVVSDWGWPTEALALILVIVSLGGLVAPKKIFYAAAVVSFLAAASVVVAPGIGYNLIAYLTLAFTGGVFALALIAARREARVSEQSNPMNLPVFG